MTMFALITLAAAFAAPAAPQSPAPVYSPVVAQDDVPQEMARGAVKSIDAAKKSFTINSGAEGAKDVAVTWNDTTVFMLEGKIVKWDEVVKENASVTVTHKKGVASKVEGVKK